MRHPVTYNYTTGKTLTAVFRDTTGVVLSQAMTEDAATGFYFITSATLATPALVAGEYHVAITEPSDGVIASGQFDWGGTAVIAVAEKIVVDDILKNLQGTVKFFASDGTTEVKQSDAYSCVIYDTDGTTVFGRIEFRDSVGVPIRSSEMAQAVRTT